MSDNYNAENIMDSILDSYSFWHTSIHGQIDYAQFHSTLEHQYDRFITYLANHYPGIPYELYTVGAQVETEYTDTDLFAITLIACATQQAINLKAFW